MSPRKRLALDTNVIYDLAAERDFAFTFLEVFKERGYELLLPPTAVQELAFAYQRRTEGWKLAEKGLTCVRNWGIRDFDLVAVGHGITEQFSLLLRTKGLLPAGECNDGYILAETALAEIPLLVTSDAHLLNIPEEALTRLFEAQDLASVAIAHPKRLLAAVSR
jgi:predicted nucleic acid-binding protein